MYPGYSAEDDYPRLEAMLAGAGPGDGGDMEPGSAATGGSGAGDGALGLAGAVTGASPAVRLPLVHTDIGEDAHRVDALLEMGSAARLAARVDELRARGAQAVVWACTSASFVFGREGAQEQVRELAQVAGLPASSTSFAFAHAIGDLGVEQVAVAATYPEDVAELFTAFLKSFGTEVVAMRGSGIITAAEVGTWGWEEVRALARAGDHPEAQAVLLPDTALHTAAYIARLEAELGKPVLTANQVTVREGLRLLAHPVPHRPRLGALFSAAAAAA
ncbi:maleate cis-trans isomerase family protein [Streptomyces xinghaiensis]|uniref:maleate cis-trans isomerase family protein n=1 Tax=Streptomyces xinghaiensis TaxID=1038928 RepID=UPI000BAE992A|nr:aspartate/glutamate racemase family protein [Streptomyces xinghaiensis]